MYLLRMKLAIRLIQAGRLLVRLAERVALEIVGKAGLLGRRV